MNEGLSQKASSFVELLIAISILSVILAGIMEVFVMSSVLGEISSNTNTAMIEAQGKIEEIKSTDSSLIVSNYVAGASPRNTFSLSSLKGMGSIFIDNSIDGLLKVTVSVSFQGRQGRIIGEDLNLNGVLDAGEDVNGNGILDSPVMLTTYIAKR